MKQYLIIKINIFNNRGDFQQQYDAIVLPFERYWLPIKCITEDVFYKKCQEGEEKGSGRKPQVEQCKVCEHHLFYYLHSFGSKVCFITGLNKTKMFFFF